MLCFFGRVGTSWYGRNKIRVSLMVPSFVCCYTFKLSLTSIGAFMDFQFVFYIFGGAAKEVLVSGLLDSVWSVPMLWPED